MGLTLSNIVGITVSEKSLLDHNETSMEVWIEPQQDGV